MLRAVLPRGNVSLVSSEAGRSALTVDSLRQCGRYQEIGQTCSRAGNCAEKAERVEKHAAMLAQEVFEYVDGTATHINATQYRSRQPLSACGRVLDFARAVFAMHTAVPRSAAV